MKLVDHLVITFCCLAVIFGLCGSFGCSSASFDLGDESDVQQIEDGSTGDSGDASPDVREEVSQPDAASLDGKQDSGREPDDALVEDVRTDSVVADSASPPSDTSVPTGNHRTATGEFYSSSLAKGIYSPALFTETISHIEAIRSGDWSGPFDTTCDLSTMGGSKAQTCQMIQKTGLGAVICPYGISYAGMTPMCPAPYSAVSWW